jgi:methylmalonyl-CoA mutase C-terminal domain/subunit
MQPDPQSCRGRILIGKPGLDGHDRGAKYIAKCLRDAGFEVVYTGIRRTPEEIAAVAVQEDVHAIGLSLLSGSHNQLFLDVLEALKRAGAGDIPVIGGGIIPPEDVEFLKQQGIREVFTSGTSIADIIQAFERAIVAHRRSRSDLNR